MTAGGVNRWWSDPSIVDTTIAGTFEGGGAKGVAYLGAIRATLEARCWFGAVTGASAGAITATLIAAGLNIEELATESDTAFTKMSPGSILDAVFRLRKNFGALDNRAVRVWLEERLQAQVKRFGVNVEGPVTFAMLYEATRIELNVVAADLTRGRQLVFSVWDTPGAQVSDAVLASSAIPFVFPAMHLEVPRPDGTSSDSHTIVDGGVWANFPTFVFDDRSYRLSAGRPIEVTQDATIGYLLAEQDEPDTDFRASRFRSLADAPPPREWRGSSAAAKQRERRRSWPSWLGQFAMKIVVLAVMIPMYPILALGSWLSLGRDPNWRGRWPTVRGFGGFVFDRVDDALSSLHAAPLAFASGIAVLVGAFLTTKAVYEDFLRHRLDDVRIDMGFDDAYAVVLDLLPVIGAVLVIVLVVAIALLVVAILIGNYVLLGPVRQAGYGVIRTYVAGPGAPTWTGKRDEDNVIRLPIPPELTTLSFDRSSPDVDEAVRQAIAAAHTTTAVRLKQILLNLKPRIEVVEGAQPSYQLHPAPDVLPYPGEPESLALRAFLAAGFVSLIVVFANLVAPTPGWMAYDVNVRFCAQQLATPEARCDEPRGSSVYANVLFGPSAAGHMTFGTVTVDQIEVQRSKAIKNPAAGRILAMDLAQNCRDTGCAMTANAYVDGQLTFRRTLVMTLDVQVH